VDDKEEKNENPAIQRAGNESTLLKEKKVPTVRPLRRGRNAIKQQRRRVKEKG